MLPDNVVKVCRKGLSMVSRTLRPLTSTSSGAFLVA